MLLQRVRELSGLRWALWEAADRCRRARAELERARAERARLERRLDGAESPLPAGTPAPQGPARSPERVDLSVVLLCPDLGRDLDPALEALARAGVRGASIAAARGGLFTEQRLLQLAREGVRVHRSPSLGGAANDAVRATSSPRALLLRATARLAPGALERCTGPTPLANPGLVVLTEEPSSAHALAALLVAGLAPSATLVGRELFDELAGFDESLEDGLELDLWLRASAANTRVSVLGGSLAAPESDRFFAGQAWGEPLERIVSRHGEALFDAAALAALSDAAEELARRFAEERALAEQADQDLFAEREALLRLGARLRERGRPRFDLGDLPRHGVVSDSWGAERGTPIDRHYIEAFLRSHEQDLRGRCLEIKEPTYTGWLGGARVTERDVLDIDAANRRATIHGDLAEGAGIPDARYDCFVLTQTLHLVYDFKGALVHALRVLKPGANLLLTVPCVSRLMPGAGGIDADYWRFTEASMRRLFAELLPLDAFTVTTYGNAAAAAGFLHGLAAEDLEPGELDRVDPHFPVIVGVRARKPR
jgi:hypothetical protein